MQRLSLNNRRPVAGVIAVAVLLALAPAVAPGEIVFYTTRSSFNTEQSDRLD